MAAEVRRTNKDAVRITFGEFPAVDDDERCLLNVGSFGRGKYVFGCQCQDVREVFAQPDRPVFKGSLVGTFDT